MKMVDVSNKKVTLRKAVAGGEIFCAPETVSLIERGEIKKGDVFAAARIAGIMAVKRTPDIVPLCHSITIQSADLELEAFTDRIAVTATVLSEGKTGVEMEALTAVSAACLCVYDMCKPVDKSMVIGDIRLLYKSGGVSGEYISDKYQPL